MIIDFTRQTAFGEPGPNFIWLVTPTELIRLIENISALCRGELQEVRYNSHAGIFLEGCSGVVFRKKNDGRTLVQLLEDGTVTAELSEDIWKQIILKLTSIDEPGSFQYIEFDDLSDLIEEGNWIVECRHHTQPGLSQPTYHDFSTLKR